MTTLNLSLAIIAFGGFIGTLPQIWGSNWKRVVQNLGFTKSILPWETVMSEIDKLADDVEKSNFKPTEIVGLGAGGAICASLLYRKLNKEQIAIDSMTYEQDGLKLSVIDTIILYSNEVTRIRSIEGGLKSKVKDILIRDINSTYTDDSRLLLVEAQHYTGDTLKKAVNALIAKGVNKDNIKTLSVFIYHPIRKSLDFSDHFHADLPIQFETKRIPYKKTMPWKKEDNSTDRYFE